MAHDPERTAYRKQITRDVRRSKEQTRYTAATRSVYQATGQLIAGDLVGAILYRTAEQLRELCAGQVSVGDDTWQCHRFRIGLEHTCAGARCGSEFAHFRDCCQCQFALSRCQPARLQGPSSISRFLLVKADAPHAIGSIALAHHTVDR